MNEKKIYEKLIELLDEAMIIANEVKEGTGILLFRAEQLQLKEAA